MNTPQAIVHHLAVTYAMRLDLDDLVELTGKSKGELCLWLDQLTLDGVLRHATVRYYAPTCGAMGYDVWEFEDYAGELADSGFDS